MSPRGYETFEHTADIGIRAWASALPDLFEEAGKALFSVIAELDNVTPAKTIQVELHAESEEELFLKWLKELLFIFDTERLVLSEFKMLDLKNLPPSPSPLPPVGGEGKRKRGQSPKKGTGTVFYLKAEASGEPINPSKHRLCREVKAITRHQFKLIREPSRFLAEVILDI